MDLLSLMDKRIVFFDGGMGSLLQEKGLRPGELPGTWNITHPEVLVQIHRDYLEAGADMVTTNTFGADELKYPDTGEYLLEDVVGAAVENAKRAIALSEKEAAVAMDIGPTGKLLKPLGDLAFEDAIAIFGRSVRAGAAAGADLILIETMSDSYEAKAAILAAKENCDLPVFLTVTFDDSGKLLTGGTPSSITAMAEGLGVDAIGINCGRGPVQMLPLVEKMAAVSSLPLIVNPNAGLPHSEDGETVYDINAMEFAEAMKRIVTAGARAVGGCCGTTPEHIRRTYELCHDLTPVPVVRKHRTVVTSFCRDVEIGKRPVIIGERINPTGKKRLKQALREDDLEYILNEGIVQAENGADILDVNVGLPEIDEAAMLEKTVRELQSIQELPLQLDTSDPAAMERALRVYNGKAMINSVNGKEESMRAIFPLMKKYGGVAIVLPLDENSIPADARGRAAIAAKVVKEAARYGISEDDLIIDGLCMTISSDVSAGRATLDTIHLIKEEYGLKTVLGVSNVSFGLPGRENLNAAFLTMALEEGLDAAIINPNSRTMMSAWRAFLALSGMDDNCSGYIEAYSGEDKIEPSAPETASMTLSQCVIKGLKEQAQSAAAELLKTEDPLDVIDSHIIPALNEVGEGFEKGTIFLPQLLLSAEAAGGAFDIIREALSESGRAGEPKGTIVLATVKGDIHDIGKNIVKVLLENYSYDVIDLGKDVPPQTIVDEVIKRHAPLVGLSALMTTTVPSMAETIKRLRSDAPWAKVMVGGAVLTQEYADSIGADAYCRDAMASVNYAAEVFG